VPNVEPPAPTRLGEVVWLEPHPGALLQGPACRSWPSPATGPAPWPASTTACSPGSGYRDRSRADSQLPGRGCARQGCLRSGGRPVSPACHL